MLWAYLAFGRGKYWSATSELPAPVPEELEHWPRTAIVVPARDEAAMLPLTLPSLLSQDYPGHAWVVLVDDESTDGTADVARSVARSAHGRALGLRVVNGKSRPKGWAGKPWAMAQGVADALSAPEQPEWVLFTDADIHHPSQSLRQLIASAVASERDSISLMARLSAKSAWERLLMPAFVYFFSQIYPFAWVNDNRRRTAAAAGGCMLVRTEALVRAGGIQAICENTIDDVALAKALKSTGSSIWLTLAGNGRAPEIESLRTYPRLAEIWEMVARNAYTQLEHDPLVLAGTIAALGSTYLAPPILTLSGLAAGRMRTAVAGAAAWSCMAATYQPIARYYGAPPMTAAALPFTAMLYMAMTLDSARRHRRGGVAWKGRQ